MKTKKCENCPTADWDGAEFYRWMLAIFDVKKARAIVQEREPDGELSPAHMKAMGLPLEAPSNGWKVDEQGRRYKTVGMGTYINEDHLSHIPKDKLNEPVIIAPFRVWSRREKNDVMSHILIDGSHRAIRLYRSGRPVYAYMLTEQEAVNICTNREKQWWKGLKKVA